MAPVPGLRRSRRPPSGCFSERWPAGAFLDHDLQSAEAVGGRRIACTHVAAGSCAGLGGFDRVTEDFHYSHDLQPGGRLDLETDNGSVDITGWDQNRIEISGQKYARSKEELKQVKVVIQVDGNNVKIPHRPSTRFMAQRVRSALSDPRAPPDLARLSSEHQRRYHRGRFVRSRACANDKWQRLPDPHRRRYDAHTTNGSIHIADGSGNFRLHTTNGALKGNLKKGAIISETTNGGVDFTVDSPTPAQPFRLHSTNGGITLRLANFAENPIKADTTNGGIRLYLPAGANAMLSADNSNSSITTDFTLSGSVNQSKHHVSGQLGSGGPPIELHTSTGGIHIQKN